MSVLADYTTPEIIREIQDIGAVALAFSGIAAIVIGIAKVALWLDKKQEDKFTQRVIEVVRPVILKAINESVRDATFIVQTEANGGLSLTDLAHNQVLIMEALGIFPDEEVHLNAE